LCPDLVHLPRFLAKYVGARFYVSHPQKVPDPNGLLAHREIATMVNMVQVVSSTRAKYSGARPGTIAPFNVLTIRHPAVAGQVRLHPLCCRVLYDVAVCSRVLSIVQLNCGLRATDVNPGPTVFNIPW